MSSSLLDAAAHGDDQALAELVRRYHHRVYRFGKRVCRDGYDADDAVQEAFIKLSARPDVAAHPGALAWLFTVVRNACLRLLRPFANGEREPLSGLEHAEAGATPEDALARFELVRQVHAAIAALEPAQREVLVLRDLEGLSGAATAAALGLTEANMKTRLHRARLALRAALLKEGP